MRERSFRRAKAVEDRDRLDRAVLQLEIDRVRHFPRHHWVERGLVNDLDPVDNIEDSTVRMMVVAIGVETARPIGHRRPDDVT